MKIKKEPYLHAECGEREMWRIVFQQYYSMSRATGGNQEYVIPKGARNILISELSHHEVAKREAMVARRPKGWGVKVRGRSTCPFLSGAFMGG